MSVIISNCSELQLVPFFVAPTLIMVLIIYFLVVWVSGWSGGAMVLGKLLVPGRPTNLDDRRARAYNACSRCSWRLFGHFYSPLSFHFFSLSLGDGPI